jgi:hypothetical protein
MGVRMTSTPVIFRVFFGKKCFVERPIYAMEEKESK